MKLFLTLIAVFSIGFLSAQNTNPFDIPARAESSLRTIPAPIENEVIDSPDITDILGSDSGFVRHFNDTLRQDIPLVLTTDTQDSSHNPFDIGARSSGQTKEVSSPKSTFKTPTILKKAVPRDTKVIALVYSVIMLIILTLAISMDQKKFGFMVQSCINSNNLRTLYRDNKAWTNGQSIVLYIFFFLNLAFVIWFMNIKMKIFPELNLFFVLGALVLCYLIRHVVMWSIASIFPIGQEVGLHNFSISLHNMVLGVFLLPFILALEFMPSVGYKTMFYGVLAVVLLLYLMRQTKGLFLSFSMRGFNLFYFFVYLCAVEIAPILVAYKMISGAL